MLHIAITIHCAAAGEGGQTALHARKYATLDLAGRVQLPRKMTRRLGMRKPGPACRGTDRIGVWPDHEPE